MPPDRHAGPPARPPRDRHAGPGGFGGGPRRSFGGPGGPREGAGPRPPFTPRPFTPGGGGGGPAHSVRLRDGDREVEVSGTPEFVRQTLDDLPGLLARLRGEAPPHTRPASISMPPPPQPAAAHVDEEDEDEEEPAPAPAPAPQTPRKAPGKTPGNGRARHGKNGAATLEDRVFDLLARAEHPLSVAGIRQQLGGAESGQQIRRILERASDRVWSTDERPAAYSLR